MLGQLLVLEEGVAFEQLAAGDEAVGHRVLLAALGALEEGTERRYTV